VAPPPEPPADSSGLAGLVGLLGFGARRSSRTAILVAAAVLDADERVERLLVGRSADVPAALLLTDRRLLLADEREWRPHVVSIDVTPGLEVHGLEQDGSATLTFARDGAAVAVLDRIADGAAARSMASAVRQRAG
jgi:hypothetical protein